MPRTTLSIPGKPAISIFSGYPVRKDAGEIP
jgi:hypothetical protein